MVLKKHHLFLGYLILVLFVANLILWSAHIATLTPYAITNEDEVVCYVKNEATAKEIIKEACTDCAKDNADIKAFSTSLAVEKAAGAKDIKSKDEATEVISEIVSNGDTDIEVVATKTGVESYLPDPTYEKDTTMLAGQSEVIEPGERGTKEVSTSYKTVNGETTDVATSDGEVLEEGKGAVMAKGTLGLPEGEEWDTYEGYPVCNDGDDIVTTAKQYLGLRYVWGGKSLETGVDCSGFVIALYRKYGVNLNYPLYEEGIEVPYSEAQPGDVLYFPGHYAIYEGDGRIIHASNKRTGVIESGIGGRKILAVRRIVTKSGKN